MQRILYNTLQSNNLLALKKSTFINHMVFNSRRLLTLCSINNVIILETAAAVIVVKMDYTDFQGSTLVLEHNE